MTSSSRPLAGLPTDRTMGQAQRLPTHGIEQLPQTDFIDSGSAVQTLRRSQNCNRSEYHGCGACDSDLAALPSLGPVARYSSPCTTKFRVILDRRE